MAPRYGTSIASMRKNAAALVLFCLASLAWAQGGPVAVLVAPVERRQVELSRELVASVEPLTRVSLAAEEPGLVSQRLFDEGDRVEKGAVLVRTDVELLKVQLSAAEAARKAMEARVEQNRAEMRNVERELKRVKEMFEKGVATEKELRDAETNRQVAAAALAARESELAEKAAEAQRLELMIRKSEIKSPISGVVARRYVEVGQWLEKGKVVADLVQLDPLFVRVNVPEALMPQVQRGMETQVTVDALGSRAFSGVVDQILPEGDAASRTFPVKILLKNPELAVRPGFFARVTLTSRSKEPTFVVPRDALVANGPETHVVVVRDGAARIVPVQRGMSEGAMLMVRGELKEGDQVIIRGNEQLRGGEAVIVLSQPPSSRSSAGG